MNRKEKIINECINNPDFSAKVYLEMANRFQDMTIDYDTFILLCEGLFNDTSKLFLKRDIATEDEAAKDIRHAHSLKRRKAEDAYKVGRTTTQEMSKDAKFNGHLSRRLKHATNDEDIKDIKLNRDMERKKKIEDNEKRKRNESRQEKINTVKNIGSAANKHKKEIGVAAGITAGVIASKKIYDAVKDRKKYKAWKEAKPKKREKVTFDQWVDLGKPLNEYINLFIDTYYDNLLK